VRRLKKKRLSRPAAPQALHVRPNHEFDHLIWPTSIV
jgi:hypothetical protein